MAMLGRDAPHYLHAGDKVLRNKNEWKKYLNGEKPDIVLVSRDDLADPDCTMFGNAETVSAGKVLDAA